MNTISFLDVLHSFVAILTLHLGASMQGAAVEASADASGITLAVVDADVRDALRMIARQGGVDIVISNEVKGTISLELNDVSLEESLNAIVGISGYEYTMFGDVITISTLSDLLERRRLRAEYAAESIERFAAQEILVLELEHMAAELVMPLVEKMLGEGGTVSMLQMPSPVDQGTGQVAASSHTLVVVDVPERLAKIDVMVDQVDVERPEYIAPQPEPVPTAEVMVIELDYVDAERVLPVVEKLLGEGGTVSLLQTSDHTAKPPEEDPLQRLQNQDPGLQIGQRLTSTSQGQPAKSHTLVVVDLPERLAQIEQVVDRIDVKPKQILIEARFVEVALDEDNKMGIDWNAVASAAGASAPNKFPFGDTTLGSNNPRVAGGPAGGSGVFPEAPNSVATPSTTGLFTFGTLDFTTFSAVLQMIQRDSRIQIVSNPRIVVGDRHTATILVGERFPVLSTNISDFGTVTEQLDHYEPIGVQLEVTPSVLRDGDIELMVRPSTSSLGPAVIGSTGLQVTRINSRQIDTSVTTQDSRTIVLGGLITSREEDVTNEVPYISRVPVLGALFRHKSSKVERVDLMVFLTVTILDGEELTDGEREMFELSTMDRERSELELSPSAPQH